MSNKLKQDCVILDEAHKIRNLTKTTKSVYNIDAKFRLAITGTPLQNNITEMFNLVNFVSNGNAILGVRKQFDNEFTNSITQVMLENFYIKLQGLFKDILETKRKLGQEKLEKLHEMIVPYVLRRTKEEQKDELNMKIKNCKINKLDLIVWLKMTEYQIQVYKKFLESDHVKQVKL